MVIFTFFEKTSTTRSKSTTTRRLRNTDLNRKCNVTQNQRFTVQSFCFVLYGFDCILQTLQIKSQEAKKENDFIKIMFDLFSGSNVYAQNFKYLPWNLQLRCFWTKILPS